MENKEEKSEILTEVTSIAKENEKSGKTMEIPGAEELVARSSANLIRNLNRLNTIISSKSTNAISRRGMTRVLNAVLNLPADKVPVLLQGEKEKEAFIIGQQIINDRFIIIQHHISQILKEKKKKEEEINNPEGGTNA